MTFCGNARISLLSVALATAALLAGCQSKTDAAIDQAKRQAAATGQAQQVVSRDKDGNVVTTVVQPPVPGQSGQATTTTVTPAAAPMVTTAATAGGTVAANTPAPASGYAPAQGSAVATADGIPAGAAAGFAPPPATGAEPVIRPAQVDIAAGTDLTIRINQHISVKSTPAGARFDGEVAEPVAEGGRVVVPRGTPVGGVVEASHRRGHFKGRSLLELRLTSMTLNGAEYPISTRDLLRSKKGKGKRSAAFIGGGAGLGMLIGGVASGGVGLLAGGLAGGGAGTAIAGLTGNRDVEIPAESIVRFRLADDLVVQVR